MADRDPNRMRKLLAQNRMAKRASVLVKLWDRYGVRASPVSHDRYWRLMDRLRGRSWPLDWTDALTEEVRAFVAGSDMVAVLGWIWEEEPALLLSADKVAANASILNDLYPAGFIIASDDKQSAMLVDIDEYDGIRVAITELPS